MFSRKGQPGPLWKKSGIGPGRDPVDLMPVFVKDQFCGRPKLASSSVNLAPGKGRSSFFNAENQEYRSVFLQRAPPGEKIFKAPGC